MEDWYPGIAVYDLHHPHHHKKLWWNIQRLSEDLKPERFILGGDNMNFDSFNHWKNDKKNLRHLEGRRIKKEYTDFKIDILDAIELVLPENCIKHYFYGNHEDWVEDEIDKNPLAEGYWEIEENLKLKERSWKVMPYKKVLQLGHLRFTHGTYFNQYHAAKHVTNYETSIVYGHTHGLQVFTKITPIKNLPHAAWNIPCCCSLNPEYRKDQPNAWVNGFAIFYIHRKTGNYQIFPIVSINGSFIFNNKEYKI